MPIVFIGLLIFLVLFLILTNIVLVPQGYAFIIERLGQYHGTWQAGLHIKIPLIDRVVKRISLKEQVLDFPPQPVITKDNVTMQIDSVVFMKVFDPKLYTYGIEDPISGLQNLTATTLRSIIGEMELDQTLTSRESINAKMLQALDKATDPWGLRLVRTEVKNIQPPKEIEEVMTKQMRAERERRQTVLEAQAHKEAVVSRTEGDKQAKMLAAEAERDAQIALAEGKAKSIELVYQAEADGLAKLSQANTSDVVLKLKGIEALKTIADGRATKIYMPTDLSNVIASLGMAGEAMGIGDATAIDKSPKPQPEPAPDPCITEETGKGGREAYKSTSRIHQEVEDRGFYDNDEETDNADPDDMATDTSQGDD